MIPLWATPPCGRDDSAAFAASLATARDQQSDLHIPPGTYKLAAGGFEWDASRHSIIGEGNVFLDHTGMTSGYAWNVSGATITPSYGFLPTIHQMAGVKVIGPDRDDTTVDAFYLNDATNGSMINFDRVFIYGFRDQLFFGVNLWCLSFCRSTFGHAHRRIIAGYLGSNSGENINFDQCRLYSSRNADGTATAVYTDKAANGDWNFTNCSFDYNDLELDHNAGNINLLGGHIEDRSIGPMVKLSYTLGCPATTLNLFGTAIDPTEPAPGRDHLFEFVSGDQIRLTRHAPRIDLWRHISKTLKVTSGAGVDLDFGSYIIR